MMDRELAPVAIHMWFKNGEGWAYHPQFNGKVGKLVNAVNKYMYPLPKQTEFCVQFDDGYLIGERLPDGNPQDPKAENRSPFILRIAYVGIENMVNSELVLERVRALSLPKDRGESIALSISLSAESVATRHVPRGAAIACQLAESDDRTPQTQIAELRETNSALVVEKNALSIQMAKVIEENNDLLMKNRRLKVIIITLVVIGVASAIAVSYV